MEAKEDLVLEKITSLYVALLVSIFVLAFPSDGYLVIAEFKYNLFLLICGGYCITIIFVRGQIAVTGIRPFRKICEYVKEIALLQKLLFAFLFFIILSAIFSEHSGIVFGLFRQEGVLTFAVYVLSCLFLSKYFVPQKWMLFLFGISTSLFCVLALIQLTGANPFTLYPEGQNYYGAGVYYPGEFLGTIGNAGLGGAYLSLATGIFAMTLIKYGFKKNGILVIAFFLSVWLIFEMNINAAVLASVVGLVVMLPVAVTNQESLSRALLVISIFVSALALSQAVDFGDGTTSFDFFQMTALLAAGFLALSAAFVCWGIAPKKLPDKWCRRGAILFSISIIFFALLYVWIFGGRHEGMIYEASEMIRGRWDDTFGTRRIFIWRNVLQLIAWENLLLGTGPDTLGHWQIEPFTRFNEELGIMVYTRIDAAHNEYLQILATTGLFSLISYLSAIILVVIGWFRSPNNKLLSVSGAGIIFYCIQAFFGISMPIVAPFLWACLGIYVYSHEKNKNIKEVL